LSSKPLVAEEVDVKATVAEEDFEVWVVVPVSLGVAAEPPVEEEPVVVAATPFSVLAPEVSPVPTSPSHVAVMLAKAGIPAELHPQSVTQAEYMAMNDVSQ
jgi:hypothetical protein